MADVKLQAILTLKDKLSGGLKKSGQEVDNFGKQAKTAGKAVAAMGVTFAAVSVKSAAKFDKSIRNIGTLLGKTANKEMPKFKKGIMEISKVIPKDADELGAAAYDVVSSGISDTSEALEVLKSSAELGVAGLSDTKDAVNILTSSLNVYGDETHDANRLAEIMFKTVKNGKTTIAELSMGFGKVAGIAKETGISIEDLQAATAALTTTGISASEAQTSLKAVISNILKPTKDATDAANKLGIEFDLNALQADGLSGMLAKVTDAAGDDQQAMADLFGSVEAANAIFALTSEEGGETFRRILQDLQTETGDLGTAVQIQSEGISGQWELMSNDMKAVTNEVGEQIANWFAPKIRDIRTMLEGGLGRTFIDDLADQMRQANPLLFGMIEKSLRLLGIVQDSGFDGDAWNNYMQTLHAQNVAQVEARQFGGSVNRGQPYMVGEAGAELFIPNEGGRIVPNGGGGGGEITINFNNATVRSDNDLEHIIMAVKQELNRDLQTEQLGI